MSDDEDEEDITEDLRERLDGDTDIVPVGDAEDEAVLTLDEPDDPIGEAEY